MKRKADKALGNERGKKAKHRQAPPGPVVAVPRLPAKGGRQPGKKKGGTETEVERIQKQYSEKERELGKLGEENAALDAGISRVKASIAEAEQMAATLTGQMKDTEHACKQSREQQEELAAWERVTMAEEDLSALRVEADEIRQEINRAQALAAGTSQSLAAVLRPEIGVLSQRIANKREEIVELGKAEQEAKSVLQSVVREEEKQLALDRELEFNIHMLKGKLYNVFVTRQGVGKEGMVRVGMGSVDVRIPQKSDSWIKLPFDLVVSKELDLCESFDCVKLLFDRTRLMIQSYMQHLPAEQPRRSVSERASKGRYDDGGEKDLTFLVLSAHNRTALVREYIEHLLANLSCLRSPTHRISAAVYPLNGTDEVLPTKLGELSDCDVSGYLAAVDKALSNNKTRGNNWALELHLYAATNESAEMGECTLKFVFLNCEDPKNLEDIQRRGREMYQSRLNGKRYSVKGGDPLLQSALLDIRMGYLLVITDGKGLETETAEEQEHMYAIAQTARTLEDCVGTAIVRP